MRYLVTGGAGFHRIESLSMSSCAAARRWWCWTIFRPERKQIWRACASKIDLHVGSYHRSGSVQSACQGADYVIHLAARTSVPRSVMNPLESNHVNIDGTLNVLVAARDAQVRRFVFAASSSAYGETPTLPKVRDACSRSPFRHTA